MNTDQGLGRSSRVARPRVAMPSLVALLALWAAGLYTMPGIAAAAPRAAKADPLVAMFEWWNRAYTQKDGFTAAAFGRHFTEDAVMRINGRDRCRGLEDLAQHFRDIQAHTEKVVVELPFLDEFRSPRGDRIFTHHFVSAREHGEDSRERVMGYVEIRHGKISLINFVSVPDPVAPAAAESATK